MSVIAPGWVTPPTTVTTVPPMREVMLVGTHVTPLKTGTWPAAVPAPMAWFWIRTTVLAPAGPVTSPPSAPIDCCSRLMSDSTQSRSLHQATSVLTEQRVREDLRLVETGGGLAAGLRRQLHDGPR